MKDADKIRLLQVLIVLGISGILVGFIPGPSSMSWIFALSIFLGIGLVLTSVCIFALINPRYRKVKIVGVYFTLPRAFLLAGPILLDIGLALTLAPVSPPTELPVYGLDFAIPGILVSSADIAVIILAWSHAKDVTLGLSR